MASNTETDKNDCLQDPNYAVICSFFDRYADTLGLPVLSYSDLEEYIAKADDVPAPLFETLIKLLRRVLKSVSVEKWERALTKFCYRYSQFDAWDVEQVGFKGCKTETKLRILKNLCESQFDYNAKFKEKVNEEPCVEQRVQPIGRDLDGLAYWFMLDREFNIRIFREEQDDTESETWEIVVKDRTDLEGLIKELENKFLGKNEEKSRSATPSVDGSETNGKSIKAEDEEVKLENGIKYETKAELNSDSEAKIQPKEEVKKEEGESESTKVSQCSDKSTEEIKIKADPVKVKKEPGEQDSSLTNHQPDKDALGFSEDGHERHIKDVKKEVHSGEKPASKESQGDTNKNESKGSNSNAKSLDIESKSCNESEDDQSKTDACQEGTTETKIHEKHLTGEKDNSRHASHSTDSQEVDNNKTQLSNEEKEVAKEEKCPEDKIKETAEQNEKKVAENCDECCKEKTAREPILELLGKTTPEKLKEKQDDTKDAENFVSDKSLSQDQNTIQNEDNNSNQKSEGEIEKEKTSTEKEKCDKTKSEKDTENVQEKEVKKIRERIENKFSSRKRKQIEQKRKCITSESSELTEESEKGEEIAPPSKRQRTKVVKSRSRRSQGKARQLRQVESSSEDENDVPLRKLQRQENTSEKGEEDVNSEKEVETSSVDKSSECSVVKGRKRKPAKDDLTNEALVKEKAAKEQKPLTNGDVKEETKVTKADSKKKGSRGKSSHKKSVQKICDDDDNEPLINLRRSSRATKGKKPLMLHYEVEEKKKLRRPMTEDLTEEQTPGKKKKKKKKGQEQEESDTETPVKLKNKKRRKYEIDADYTPGGHKKRKKKICLQSESSEEEFEIHEEEESDESLKFSSSDTEFESDSDGEEYHPLGRNAQRAEAKKKKVPTATLR